MRATSVPAKNFCAVEELVDDPDDPRCVASEAATDAASDRLDACVQRIWATRATNIYDAIIQVLIRGAIAEHFSNQTDGYSGDGTRLPLEFLDPQELVRCQRPPVCDDSAIAHLLDAVRQLNDLWTTTAPDTADLPRAQLDTARANYLASDWYRIITAHLDAMAVRGMTDEEVERLLNDLCENTKAIWARPCATWDDLIERAAIAVYWNSPDELSEPTYPDDVLACEPDADHDRGYDDHALAHVVKAILDQSGLKFDQEGRLL